jgi:molybdopterin converting factor small subunit
MMFMETLGGAGDADEKACAPRRKKIWETGQAFRCPVVGMCLNVKEQRSLCRKVGADMRTKSDFNVHEMVVTAMSGENPLSRKLENMLTEKYEDSCSIYLNMAENEFLDCWHKALKSGDYAGLLWTAAVRPLSTVAQVDVFGSLHMTVHEHAKKYSESCKARNTAEEKALRLKNRAEKIERQRLKLQTENEELRKELMHAGEQQKEPRREQNAASEKLAAQDTKELRAVLARLEKAKNKIQTLQKQVEEKDVELLQLIEKFLDLDQEYHVLLEEVEAHRAMYEAKPEPPPESKKCNCSPDCPSYDLCEKRILIVGGIERMESAYRKLVEERGGILEYHAGHMKSGGKALENSFQRADLVLCPVNCNSHGACRMVKNLGKKYNKPVHMLPNFSLSTLARTVEEIHAD